MVTIEVSLISLYAIMPRLIDLVLHKSFTVQVQEKQKRYETWLNVKDFDSGTYIVIIGDGDAHKSQHSFGLKFLNKGGIIIEQFKIY